MWKVNIAEIQKNILKIFKHLKRFKKFNSSNIKTILDNKTNVNFVTI